MDRVAWANDPKGAKGAKGVIVERHKRALFGAVFALYLIVGAWQLWAEPWNAPYLGFLVFPRLLPPFGAAVITVRGLMMVRAARTGEPGEPLDRRPAHAALVGVALTWIAVFIVVLGGVVSAFATAIAGIAFLVGALVDWLDLFALLRSRTLVEHRDAGVAAPPVVGGIASPVVLFDPGAAGSGYRDDAKGKPIASIPLDRATARNRLSAQVVMALTCSFIALPGGALAAAPIVEGDDAHAAASASAPGSKLAGTRWRGEVDLGRRKHRFTLEIETAAYGQLTGVMDWGDVAANVEGTYEGDTLVFYDRSIRRTNGAPFMLNDRKDVTIAGDEMVGTDKAGSARLTAHRVR